jgi:hypothetical protein
VLEGSEFKMFFGENVNEIKCEIIDIFIIFARELPENR